MYMYVSLCYNCLHFVCVFIFTYIHIYSLPQEVPTPSLQDLPLARENLHRDFMRSSQEAFERVELMSLERGLIYKFIPKFHIFTQG